VVVVNPDPPFSEDTEHAPPPPPAIINGVAPDKIPEPPPPEPEL
jgi:hypothetical protein